MLMRMLKAVAGFLVRYVPLVDGLMTFTRHNVFRCLMERNARLPARIDPAAVFHTHLFSYVDHVQVQLPPVPGLNARLGWTIWSTGTARGALGR